MGNVKVSSSYEFVTQTTTDESSNIKDTKADEKVYTSKENHCYVIIQICDIHEIFENAKSIGVLFVPSGTTTTYLVCKDYKLEKTQVFNDIYDSGEFLKSSIANLQASEEFHNFGYYETKIQFN